MILLGTLSNIVKTGTMAMAQLEIETVAYHLSNEGNGMGTVPHRQIVGRRGVNHMVKVISETDPLNTLKDVLKPCVYTHRRVILVERLAKDFVLNTCKRY